MKKSLVGGTFACSAFVFFVFFGAGGVSCMSASSTRVGCKNGAHTYVLCANGGGVGGAHWLQEGCIYMWWVCA